MTDDLRVEFWTTSSAVRGHASHNSPIPSPAMRLTSVALVVAIGLIANHLSILGALDAEGNVVLRR